MKALLITFILCLSFAACNQNDSSTNTAIEGDNHITSNFKFKQIDAYAKNEDNTLRLKFISSDNVSYDGCSNSWSYKYSKVLDSPAYYSKSYYLSSFYDSICCDSIVTEKSTVGDAYISKSWINSDIALKIAESKGGREFREKNPAYNIDASLGEAVVPNSYPVWNIRYTSSASSSINLVVRINAVTGSAE